MRLLLAKYICVCKIYTSFFLSHEILYEKLTTRMPDGADKYFCELDSIIYILNHCLHSKFDFVPL